MPGSTSRRCIPAGRPADKELPEQLDVENFLGVAEKMHKAGYPFGLGLSTCTDALNMVGAMFASYGVNLVDPKGAITVKNDKTRQASNGFRSSPSSCRARSSPMTTHRTTRRWCRGSPR